MADGSATRTFASDIVRTQVLADANAMLRFLGKKSVADLSSVQAALESASALECGAVVVDLSGAGPVSA
jgi:hypothetical protein